MLKNTVLVDDTGCPEPMLIEPYVVQLTYSDGLSFADVGASGNAILTFFADQRSADSLDGRMDRIVVARLVMPKTALLDVVAKLLAATGTTPVLVRPTHLEGGRA